MRRSGALASRKYIFCDLQKGMQIIWWSFVLKRTGDKSGKV
jgi:hypothetical protein